MSHRDTRCTTDLNPSALTRERRMYAAQEPTLMRDTQSCRPGISARSSAIQHEARRPGVRCESRGGLFDRTREAVVRSRLFAEQVARLLRLDAMPRNRSMPSSCVEVSGLRVSSVSERRHFCAAKYVISSTCMAVSTKIHAFNMKSWKVRVHENGLVGKTFLQNL